MKTPERISCRKEQRPPMSTNNNIEQNGRQQPPPPTDPRPGSTSDQPKPVCRKYVWGTCNKSTHCIFRHELVFEEMKNILKFCHDYQNKQGCTRIDCSYLHTTNEEENLFLTTGQLPRVLRERYIAMSETTNGLLNTEPTSPMVMFGTPPPPPPPPPVPLMTPAVPPPPPQPESAFPTVQQPPPPPPPPPPSPSPSLSTTPTTSVAQASPGFTAPPPQSTPVTFSLNQPPPTLLPLVPVFDATRPPPPIPEKIKNGTIKRRINICEVVPSKVRKAEDSKPADKSCENCVEMEIRIEVYKLQVDKVQEEEEYQALAYKKKLEDYEGAKGVLRSLVTPELYLLLEEYVEGSPPSVQDMFAQLTQNPFVLNSSTIPNEFIMQLLEYVFNNARHLMDSPATPGIIKNLRSLTRRTGSMNQPTSAEIIQIVFELLQCVNNSERAQAKEPRTSEEATASSSTNGPSRNKNGQDVESPTPVTSNANKPPSSPSTPSQSCTTSVAESPSSGSKYPPYHPGIPPPVTRPGFQPFSSTSENSSVNHNSARAIAPVTAPTPARPPTTSVAPAMPPTQNYNNYMMIRYPHPPYYYPPFQ